MFHFIVKSKGGVITPLNDSKKKFFSKLLKQFEDEDISFKVTIERTGPNINEGQLKLYRAFIIKAADHFGNDFRSMEILLHPFWPEVPFEDMRIRKPVHRWSSKELDDFITKSTALLAEHGFNF